MVICQMAGKSHQDLLPPLFSNPYNFLKAEDDPEGIRSKGRI